MNTSIPPSEPLATLVGQLVGQVAVYALMRRLAAPRWAALAAAATTGHLASAAPSPKLTAEDVAQTMIDRLARDQLARTAAAAIAPTIVTVADPITITMHRDDANRALVERGWTIQVVGDGDEVAYVRPSGKPWKWAGEGRVGTDYFWHLDEALLDALGFRPGA